MDLLSLRDDETDLDGRYPACMPSLESTEPNNGCSTMSAQVRECMSLHDVGILAAVSIACHHTIHDERQVRLRMEMPEIVG